MALTSEASELTLTLTQTAPVVLASRRPRSVDVLEGDDVILTVPLAPESGEPASVTWTRGDDPLLGERFSSSTQRGAVTLTVRNATVEDAGRYSLQAHNLAGQTHTDVLLEVRTRPGDVPVFLRRLNDLAVKVGTRTRFLVEVRSPTQVKVSWEQEGKPLVEGERFHLLHEGSFFCVDVAPVTLEDAGLWICRAHNSNGTATCFCHLNVLVPKAYKAPHFLEELVAILTQQGTVSLECKVVGVPTPTLKWFKDNQEIKAGDMFALSANPEDATSLGTYTCEATNCMGKAYSTSRVHVLNKDGAVMPADSLIPKGPVPVFTTELKNEKVKIGGKLSLECKVNVPPWPKTITWFNTAGVVEGGGRYHVMEDGLGAYSVEVSPVEATEEGEWKCVATSAAGVKGVSVCNVSVSYPKNYKKPKFLESLKAILTEEGLVSFECKVVGYPTPQLRWFKDGQELKPGDVYQLTGTNSLGSYCCIAKNCMGETSSTAELTVEDIQSQLSEEDRLQLFSKTQPPHFLHGLKSLEAKITDTLRFTVQVSVSPQPTVAWYRDDEEVKESERYKTEQETKGVCHLTIRKLELLDQAEWKCVATNDYGQSVTSCFLKLNIPRHYKKPRFLENLRAVLSEEGAVNLECKVIGVPQPTLKWYKDGRELKPGDIHRIISGQDGTCCLGTYTCEAHNCMGTVSSSASLLGFEDRAQVKPVEPLRPLPPPSAHLVRHPSLSTIQEERTSQLHDTVASDDRAEVSFSFDGKEVSVSLYETPDLTEEEALQVVEMYAEELSEHISGLQEVKSLEHNLVELPPMRFVKETSTSGHLLMEAVVIDVSPEYYASAEDRTEADLDEFSITEDNGFMSPIILSPEEMPFEKFTSDFLERSIQPLASEQKSVPVKPPRKRGADASESSSHSFKEAKVSPEEESSDHFVDALSSREKSQRESYGSAKAGSEEKQLAVTDGRMEIVKPNEEIRHLSLKESESKLSETKKLRKKSRSRSKSIEDQSRVNDNLGDADLGKKIQKRQFKKRKSTDSEKEDDSLREFEKRKAMQSENLSEEQSQKRWTAKKSKSSESEKEDDSLQEFESRKSMPKSEKDSENQSIGKFKSKSYTKLTSDSSGREDDSLIEYENRKLSTNVTSEKVATKMERQKIPIKKSMSTDSSEKDEDFALKTETSDQSSSRKKRKRSVKKTDKKDQPTEAGVGELPPSSEAESMGRGSLKDIKGVSTSDLDRMRSISDLDSIGDKSKAQEEEDHSADFDTAEDSAYDKSEMSVLESLTHSIKEIQKGLAAMEEKILSESSDEPHTAKSSLSFVESLAQSVNEIQKGLVKVEKCAEENETGMYSPSSILESIKEPVEELTRNLALIEQTNDKGENIEETFLKKTSHSLLETVGQPLQDLKKEIAFIQQQATIETGDDTFSEMFQSFKPSLMVAEGGVEQTVSELSSKLDDITEVTVLPQPTYAQLAVEADHIENQHTLLVETDCSFVPLTVHEIEDSLADTVTALQSKSSDLCNELEVYALGLENCKYELKEKVQQFSDNEIKDILTATSNLIVPLEQFRMVIDKCLKLVVEYDKSSDQQIRSTNMVLKAALENSVHAFSRSFQLLETVAHSGSDKEIRGLGIRLLYKLSFPLEELKTTMKLVEHLSEHTSIELLMTPVEHLTAAVSVIDPKAAKVGFAENVCDGVFIVNELHNTIASLIISLQSTEKSLNKHSSLLILSSLTKPLGDLQRNIHKLENQLQFKDNFNQINSLEVYSLAQDLCKPLQAVRTELSLAQHEIELDQYSLSFSPDLMEGGGNESAASVVQQSLDQVQKSVLTCTEFILSMSPNESLHLRYLLFALNELILPFNQLASSIEKAGEIIVKEAPKVSDPNLGIQSVAVSTCGLLDVLQGLQHQTTISLNEPESVLVQVMCTMANPLAQVKEGLHKVIERIHEEDKTVLNINMLKTLAEPLKNFQKSLITISERFDSDLAANDIFLELRQPVHDLQRSILVIQDQVSFEYGDEPATIESNICTLQSLIQPLNVLKEHFIEIDRRIIDKTHSTSYSKDHKDLHSIIKINHELQRKLSSMMIQDNYLSKHSLESLDMFPIFQDLCSTFRDFESSLKRINLICRDETKPEIVVHNKLIETVNHFKCEVSYIQDKIITASDKAMKNGNHPVHFLKKVTQSFLDKLSTDIELVMSFKLDDVSIDIANSTFRQHLSIAISQLSDSLTFIQNFDENQCISTEDKKESFDVSLVSSSDTIKDVNTIVDEISHSRISLMSTDISSHKSVSRLQLCQEFQNFCESLKYVEDGIVKNTLIKANSSEVGKEEKQALINAFISMKMHLKNIEKYVAENLDVVKAISNLSNAIDEIQEHLNHAEQMSEAYILHTLSSPLKIFQEASFIGGIKPSTEVKDFVSASSYLDRFEKSASDLELGLMKLEHALLNSTGDFSSLKNIDIDVLSHPIKELVQYIDSIEAHQTSLSWSETLADQSSLSMLKTLAEPIREIQHGVLEIQEHLVLESSGKSHQSGKSCASILYEIAKPIRELRSGVALIQEQIVIMEADVEPLTEDTRASSLQTLAAPVEELKKVLECIIEQQTLLLEPDVQSMSENISLLKTIAQPTKELQNKLAAININQVLEGNVEPFSIKEELLALAKPIHILQEGIVLIQSQLTYETLGSDLSAHTDMSLLKKVAKPLLEVAKGIALISENQFVEVADNEGISTMSDLSTLANVTDASFLSDIVCVQEPVMLEQGISLKETMPPVQYASAIRQEHLDVAVNEQQQVMMEAVPNSEHYLKFKTEKLSEENILSVTDRETGQPIIGIQQTLSQVETLNISDEDTLQYISIQEASQKCPVQVDIQEVLLFAETLPLEDNSLKAAVVENSSLHAAQCGIQEPLLGEKTLTAETLSLFPTKGEEGVEPACVVQGELQQSLADVESLVTDEDTVESISMQEASFKLEPQVNIQQTFSGVESLTLTEHSVQKAEVKEGIRMAIVNEEQEILTQEGTLMSFDKSSESALIDQATPLFAANLQIQQTLTDVESFKDDSVKAKHSQHIAIEEVNKQIAIQTEIQELISIAEDVKSTKEGIKAKLISDSSVYEPIQQEVFEALEVVEQIEMLNEALKANLSEEPPLHLASLEQIQQVLTACERIENIKETLQHSSPIVKDEKIAVLEMLSSAQHIGNITQSVSAKMKEVKDHDVTVGSEGIVKQSPSESHQNILELTAKETPVDYIITDTDKGVCSKEDNKNKITTFIGEQKIQTAIQNEIQDLNSVAEDLSTMKDTFQLKLTKEPQIKNVIGNEIQQVFCVVEEMKVLNHLLQAGSEEQTHRLQQAVQSSIEQIFEACDHIQSANEALQAKISNKSDLKTAVQSELQLLLTSAERMKSIKEAITVKVAETESSKQNTVKVESAMVLSSNENIEDFPQPLKEQKGTIIKESTFKIEEQQPACVENVLTVSHQTEFKELITVADDIKKIKEHLEAKTFQQPQLNEVTKMNIQLVLSVANEVELCKDTLQADSVLNRPVLQATQTEMQQILDTCEQTLLHVQEQLQIKPTKELEVKVALQPEIQQMLTCADILHNIKEAMIAKVTEIESLSTVTTVDAQNILHSGEKIKDSSESPEPFLKVSDTIETKSDQKYLDFNILKAGESHITDPDYQLEFEGILTVAEEISRQAESLQARIIESPQIKKVAHIEIQQVLDVANEIKSFQENVQHGLISTRHEAGLNKTDILKVLDIFKNTCQNVEKTLCATPNKELLLKIHQQSELQQVTACVSTMQNISEAITAKMCQIESLTVGDENHLLPRDGLDITTPPDTQELRLVRVPTETVLNTSVADEITDTKYHSLNTFENEMQNFISVAESISNTKECLKAKIKTGSKLNNAAQEEIQQVLNVVEEIKSLEENLKEKLDMKTQQSTSLQEVQQILIVCEKIEGAVINLESKASKEVTLKSAVQSELQQILNSVDSLQNIKRAISSKVSQVESLSDIGQIEIKDCLSFSDTSPVLSQTGQLGVTKETQKENIKISEMETKSLEDGSNALETMLVSETQPDEAQILPTNNKKTGAFDKVSEPEKRYERHVVNETADEVIKHDTDLTVTEADKFVEQEIIQNKKIDKRNKKSDIEQIKEPTTKHSEESCDISKHSEVEVKLITRHEEHEHKQKIMPDKHTVNEEKTAKETEDGKHEIAKGEPAITVEDIKKLTLDEDISPLANVPKIPKTELKIVEQEHVIENKDKDKEDEISQDTAKTIDIIKQSDEKDYKKSHEEIREKLDKTNDDELTNKVLGTKKLDKTSKPSDDKSTKGINEGQKNYTKDKGTEEKVRGEEEEEDKDAEEKFGGEVEEGASKVSKILKSKLKVDQEQVIENEDKDKQDNISQDAKTIGINKKSDKKGFKKDHEEMKDEWVKTNDDELNNKILETKQTDKKTKPRDDKPSKDINEDKNKITETRVTKDQGTVVKVGNEEVQEEKVSKMSKTELKNEQEQVIENKDKDKEDKMISQDTANTIGLNKQSNEKGFKKDHEEIKDELVKTNYDELTNKVIETKTLDKTSKPSDDKSTKDINEDNKNIYKAKDKEEKGEGKVEQEAKLSKIPKAELKDVEQDQEIKNKETDKISQYTPKTVDINEQSVEKGFKDHDEIKDKLEKLDKETKPSDDKSTKDINKDKKKITKVTQIKGTEVDVVVEGEPKLKVSKTELKVIEQDQVIENEQKDKQDKISQDTAETVDINEQSNRKSVRKDHEEIKDKLDKTNNDELTNKVMKTKKIGKKSNLSDENVSIDKKEDKEVSPKISGIDKKSIEEDKKPSYTSPGGDKSSKRMNESAESNIKISGIKKKSEKGQNEVIKINEDQIEENIQTGLKVNQIEQEGKAVGSVTVSEENKLKQACTETMDTNEIKIKDNKTKAGTKHKDREALKQTEKEVPKEPEVFNDEATKSIHEELIEKSQTLGKVSIKDVSKQNINVDSEEKVLEEKYNIKANKIVDLSEGKTDPKQQILDKTYVVTGANGELVHKKIEKGIKRDEDISKEDRRKRHEEGAKEKYVNYENYKSVDTKKSKLYIDESSTSDYSSESYSESLKMKKSRSYDTRQWESELNNKSYEYEPKQTIRSKYERPHRYETFDQQDKSRSMKRQAEMKPLFCGRLVDRTAASGSRLRVTCSLTGSPDPEVQWYKDGQHLTTAQDPRVLTRLSCGLASLEISDARVGDSGKYSCVATNSLGEATTTCTIKIFSYLDSAPQAPIFTLKIKERYKCSSDELVVECRVRGHPTPSVTWLKDEQPLRALSRYEQSVLTDGTCRLTIHGPEPSDSGLYKCVAENAVWSEHTSGYVSFEGREKYLTESRSLTDTRVPRFTNVLPSHTVREGGTVALQVAIKGTPRAEVTWYRGKDPLPKKSTRYRYLEEGGVYSLVMSDASATEAGTYVCRASNLHGSRDTSVNVEVVGGASRGKPAMFLSRPDTSLNLATGEDVTISFRVSGDPKPRVTWMKGMKDITNNVRTMKETINDYVRLTLKHVNIMDAGTYFIMAKNIYGADHAFVTVRVKQRARSLTPTRSSLWSAPDTSTILRDIHESTRSLINDVPGPISGEPTVSDAGKNWVSLTWGKPEHRGASPVLAYRVEAWLLGTDGGAHWTELGITPINSFDAFFLKPGAEYKFRITARNRYGWGEAVTTTEPIHIGLAANYPPDIVRDLAGPFKALAGDNITLECEVSGDPAPSIQWLRDGQDVGMVSALKGRVFVSDSQLTHRLILKQLTDEDSGRYVCEAVNKLGRASTYARLLVVTDPRLLEADKKLKQHMAEDQDSAPQFTMRLRDRRVQATYPVRLTCQVAGNPVPTVTWTRDGSTITSSDHCQTVVEADHFHTLEISRTALEDGGEYTATAQNCLGAVTCHCQLVVDKGIRAYVAPEFISDLQPALNVREGAELRLFAQVEAYPTVGIAWQRDGVRLRPSRRLVMTCDPEGRVELALANITPRDQGVFSCCASNAVGRAETSCQVTITPSSTPATITANIPAIISTTVPYSAEPRFVVKPRSSEAVEGDTVVITCEVVGDPQPEVMWLRDWLKPGYYRDAPQFRQVAGASQYCLEIPQVKLDFTGTYCVIARNPHGEAKAIISLQIFAKGQGKESSMVAGHIKHGKVETLPEIKRELRDVRCCDGDSATLECLVQATPPPSVRWEKDGKILPLGEELEAEVDGEVARLTIKKVYPEDEGQYSCVAFNELGKAVTSACLVVDVPEEKETLLSQHLSRPPGLLSARSTPRSTPRNTPSPARSLSPQPYRCREFSSPSFSRPKRIKMSSPKFYTVPHNRIAEEGETVRFQCAVAGHPPPWASWDKDGHIVTPSSRLTVLERDDVRTLELREVTVEDAGLYRVTLENEMGSVEATARLDVIGRQGSRTRSVRAWSAMRASPTFGRRLVGSAARVGGTFTLNCEVNASPSPVTSWYRNGEMLVKSERVVPSWDGRRARLEMRDLEASDAGVYTCVAENMVGTTQCSAELQILNTSDPSDADLQPPVFLQGLQPELTAAEGQPQELTVRLQGSSPLEVVWVKDGVEIPDCADFRYVDYGDGRFGLRIADLFVGDSGIYNCEAFNDHGDAITSGHLVVTDLSSGGRGQPDICFTKTPSPVMARRGGSASFCARLQRVPLCHSSFSWSVGGHTVSSDDDRFSVLTEEDCSILQVRDVCGGDVGEVRCTARVCSPGEAPVVVTCHTQLSLDAAAGCPATLLRGPSDTTAMRGDRVLLKATYRGSPEPSVRWLKAGRELHTEGRVQITTRDGVSCLTVSAITADDSGKYVVSVENIHGADCHFASVAVEGPPEPPAARPSVCGGEDSVSVAWSSPVYDGGCVLTGYQVEMRTVDSPHWSVVADRCHSLSYVVRGLVPGQTYVFRVRAENIHGASESSAESFPFTFQPPEMRGEEGEGDRDSEVQCGEVCLEPGDQFLQRYSVHEELGRGRYGVVHKVTDLRSGSTLAAKFVRCIKKQDREKVQEEIDIMNCLRHPKLLQLASAFDNPKDIIMVMEYITGGELFERVVADDFTLTERDCILFLKQICEGVSYMHTNHVVHLDLKPENIMCHTRTSHRVKIIDFGLAQKLETDVPVRVMFGTPEFIPPEIINYEPIGTETDMWSVGVITYVLLSGLSPFMGDNDAETLANITRADFDFDDEAFDAISQDAKDFISSLLVKRKEKRLTAEQCLHHQWLNQCHTSMSTVSLSTDKLKKFIIRRKWQPRNERQIA